MRAEKGYQVVKSLRNWAMAPARKAERRGRLEASKGAGNVLMEDEAASPTVITSSINTHHKTVPLVARRKLQQRREDPIPIGEEG